MNGKKIIKRMMQVSYPAHITEQTDDSYLVQFIDLPDTFTEGPTMDEALFNASEVLSGMLIKGTTSFLQH